MFLVESAWCKVALSMDMLQGARSHTMHCECLFITQPDIKCPFGNRIDTHIALTRSLVEKITTLLVNRGFYTGKNEVL